MQDIILYCATIMTTVVNISKKVLNENGIENLEEWLENPNNVYIGRNMSFYVKGAVGSKWQNKHKVKALGIDKCLREYENDIKCNPDLMSSLCELKGKTLGCWCKPNKCHGDILVKLIEES